MTENGNDDNSGGLARLPMLTEAEASRRGRELGIDDYISRMNLFRVLLHSPALAAQLNGTIMALVGAGKALDDRLRELVIMRVSWLTGCEYEWAQHWQAALYFGLTQKELVAVQNWRAEQCFNGAERAVLAVTDELVRSGAVQAATWQELKRHLTDDVLLLEVVACIGNWHMFAQILRALEIPLEPGVASWPPHGRAPSV